MSSPDETNATIAVQEHLLQDSESSDQKPRLAAGDDEIQRDGAIQPQKLQRYWARTIVLILVPAIITAWYGTIWVALVLGIENDEVVKYRTFSGSLIYYSWFIIGVFGLSWSKYGLAGVEVAMLQTPFWRAPNMVAFLMHSNNTWTSPSGWVMAVRHRQSNRLWCLLAFLSVLPFIAFPLSGLVFEISDGYIQSSTHPFVVGRNVSTFNEVYNLGTPVEDAWMAGLDPIMPGFGVIYTPPGLDRTKYPSSFGRVPNTLPLADPVLDMFFAPQADVPLSGKAWGLRVKYDCSIVRDVSELTILSQKPESTLVHVLNYTLEDGFGPSTKSPYVTLQTPDGDEIYIFNTGVSPDTENVWAYTEMGTKTNPDEATSYDGSHSDFDDVTESMVLEYAIWQVQYMGYEFPEDPNNPLPFNTTISPAIKGMGSPFIKSGVRLVEDDGFFEIRAGDSYEEEDEIRRFKQVDKAVTDLRDIFDNSQLIGLDTALSVAAPMGVRCVVSSGLGAATLDGVTSTFSDFERVDPDVVEDYTGESIFGERVIYNLGLEKFFEFYQISHLPASVPQGTQYRRQGYVHPQALQEVLMLGYGTSALDFMYNINPSPDSAWLNPDVWASEEGKILTQASLIPGTAVGYLVLALFCIWSVLSAALGIVYGFRKRPSDKLDGESVFRRGVDMSEDVKHDNEFQSGKTFYANKKFQALPGS